MQTGRDAGVLRNACCAAARWLAAGACAALVVGLVGGCEGETQRGKPPAETGSDAATAAPAEAEADEKYVIGFSQCTLSEPWRVEFNRRLKAHAEEHYPNVELVMLDADDRTEVQVAQVRTFIERDVDAILVSPKEAPGLTDPVKEATEAGIPVIVLDRDVRWDGYACFVGGDNMLIGRTAGEVVVDMLGGPGQAAGVVYEICGGMASTPAQERHKGFHQIVDDEPGIKVIGEQDCDWKLPEAKETFKAALRSHDDIDVVYAHNDPMAYGAYQAAKEAGRHEEIRFVGIDALPAEGRRWISNGALDATIQYTTPGETGLDLAVKLLQGEDIPKRVRLGTRVFTPENIEQGGREVTADEE